MTDPDPAPDLADDLLGFIDASPTPFHACREAAHRLERAGFRRLDEGEAWRLQPGERAYVVRDGSSLAAFEVGAAPPGRAGFMLLGAHTDSPNLRLKPQPELTRSGCHQLSFEVYGGVLLSTWVDRDLSLAGRVVVQRNGHPHEAHLVDLRQPLMRVPSLAIHLDRQVNTEGLVLNPQKHVVPIVGLESSGPLDLRRLLAEALQADGHEAAPSTVLSWDLCAYDVQPSARSGLARELIHAPRLDNLASCHAALSALTATAGNGTDTTKVVVLYDHEEVGSRSARGAASPFLRSLLDRITSTAAGDEGPDALARALSRSFLLSADMAHAVHPNYADRHDTEHMPVLGQGPVVKINANQAYATDGLGWGRFETLCREADVTPQRFVSRGDVPCGSTIGPITAAELGIPTVDVGNPMLSMHSCREMAAADDVPRMIAVMHQLFGG